MASIGRTLPAGPTKGSSTPWPWCTGCWRLPRVVSPGWAPPAPRAPSTASSRRGSPACRVCRAPVRRPALPLSACAQPSHPSLNADCNRRRQLQPAGPRLPVLREHQCLRRRRDRALADPRLRPKRSLAAERLRPEPLQHDRLPTRLPHPAGRRGHGPRLHPERPAHDLPHRDLRPAHRERQAGRNRRLGPRQHRVIFH